MKGLALFCGSNCISRLMLHFQGRGRDPDKPISTPVIFYVTDHSKAVHPIWFSVFAYFGFWTIFTFCVSR